MSLEKKISSKAVIKRLIKEHVKPYRSKIIVAVIFMVISAMCAASIVSLVKPAVDEIFMTHDRKMLYVVPLAIFFVYTIKGVAEYFQSYIIKYVGQQILTNLQMRMYAHLLSSDFLFLQSQSSGRLISRFTNDIMLMRGAVSTMLIGCAKHFLSVVFLIILMFSLEPFLSAFVFFAFPFAIYPIQKLGRRMRMVTGEAQEELSHFTSRLDEVFASIRVIKSFCMERSEVSRAKRITDNILSFYKRSARFDSLTSPIMEVLSGATIAGVIWYGGLAVIEGRMTTGALFAFITAFASAYRPFKSLVALNVNLQEGIAAANRVFNVLDLKPTITDIDNPLKPKWQSPEIEFKNIDLKFGKKAAIKSVNLKIEYGQTYAFVGGSGSGKTTMANLLVRFFDPNQGSITIDGEDIKNISLHHLRSQIAMVTQDTMLFDASVSDNISYGLKKPSKADIIAAAKAADAHEFIEALPNKYDTMIGVSGSSLSGGQKQRLSIARAFLKNAPILLLDEATSSLDNHSEQSIINSVDELRKNRTTLIITHRLRSIVDVDQIVVMNHGKIIEQGTHEELQNLKKEYYKLYNKELKENNNSV
ncbi:MAG: ABC transporter ATP-binding protein [Rickettsiaceae bacterium]|nr:ABC transporter ATP-binding protein [Rickettsiaceae bacterium]